MLLTLFRGNKNFQCVAGIEVGQGEHGHRLLRRYCAGYFRHAWRQAECLLVQHGYCDSLGSSARLASPVSTCGALTPTVSVVLADVARPSADNEPPVSSR